MKMRWSNSSATRAFTSVLVRSVLLDQLCSMTFLLIKKCYDEVCDDRKRIGNSESLWHSCDFTLNDPKEGRFIWVAIPEKDCAVFYGWIFLKTFGWVKGFCMKWTPQSPGSRLKHYHSTVVWFWIQLSEWRIFPNPRLWLLKSMKDRIGQTKDPGHKYTTQRRSRNALLLATPLHCFDTLPLSVKVQQSNWMSLAVRGDVENEASFCWHQRISVRVAPADCLACGSILNHSNLTSAHADCILFRPLKFGWSTAVGYRQSRSQCLRLAFCGSLSWQYLE